jgi:thioredoxin-like negative regulator of GroEL
VLKPVVQEVSSELGVHIQYIDAQQNMQLATQYNVAAVPTILVIQDNVVVKRHTGLTSKESLKQLFTL